MDDGSAGGEDGPVYTRAYKGIENIELI